MSVSICFIFLESVHRCTAETIENKKKEIINKIIKLKIKTAGKDEKLMVVVVVLVLLLLIIIIISK